MVSAWKHFIIGEAAYQLKSCGGKYGLLSVANTTCIMVVILKEIGKGFFSSPMPKINVGVYTSEASKRYIPTRFGVLGSILST